MSRQEAPQVENHGYCRDSVISMDAMRAGQFTSVMFRIYKNVQSLNATATSFPQPDLDEGEMDARATVVAFCRPLLDDINLMYKFIENDEPKQPIENGGE